MTRTFASMVILAALVVVAIHVTGCGGPALSITPDIGAFDSSNAHEVAEGVERPSWLGDPTAAAPDIRHDALVALRSTGVDGAALADLLTEEFPGEARSAPFFAGSGTYEGVQAWFVLEAWGSSGEEMDQVRLWVFDAQTWRVLFTGAIN